MSTLRRDPRNADRAESGTVSGSPLGEAFSWLHSAEKKDGGVTNPLFGWLAKTCTSNRSTSPASPASAAPSAPGEEPSFLYKRAAPRSTTESPLKRRRTTTRGYIEQDLQEAIEMDVKRKGPTRRNRTKTWPNSEPWPCDGPWPSQQLSQDTPATLAPLSPGTAASLTMASQHVKVPS